MNTSARSSVGVHLVCRPTAPGSSVLVLSKTARACAYVLAWRAHVRALVRGVACMRACVRGMACMCVRHACVYVRACVHSWRCVLACVRHACARRGLAQVLTRLCVSVAELGASWDSFVRAKGTHFRNPKLPIPNP